MLPQPCRSGQWFGRAAYESGKQNLKAQRTLRNAAENAEESRKRLPHVSRKTARHGAWFLKSGSCGCGLGVWGLNGFDDRIGELAGAGLASDVASQLVAGAIDPLESAFDLVSCRIFAEMTQHEQPGANDGSGIG